MLLFLFSVSAKALIPVNSLAVMWFPYFVLSPSSVKRTQLIKTNFPLPFVKKNITLGHMDYCEVFPCPQKCPAAAGYSLNKLRVMCNVVSPQVKTT